MCDDDPRAIVQNAYDNISKWYLDWVGTQNSPRERYTKLLLEELAKSSPSILELGCGPGIHTMRMLLDSGAKVTGNDISSQQLNLAKSRCPEAELVVGDMASLSFDPGTFEGVVCFYTLFHLPRAEQKDLLQSKRVQSFEKQLHNNGQLSYHFTDSTTPNTIWAHPKLK